jgi:hypothetical protein
MLPSGPPCPRSCGYVTDDEINIFPLLPFEVVKDDYVGSH